MMMTENQAEQLFTVTIESRRPDTHHWDITAQATDTLAGLVEWAAPANPVCEPPRLPLTAEAVRGFIGATFEREDVRNRVRLEPAAPGLATAGRCEVFPSSPLRLYCSTEKGI